MDRTRDRTDPYGTGNQPTGGAKAVPVGSHDGPADRCPAAEDAPCAQLSAQEVDPAATEVRTTLERAAVDSRQSSEALGAAGVSRTERIDVAPECRLSSDGIPAATTIARYFKLTLALVCVNVAVAATNVVAVFRHSDEPRTVVVSQVPHTVLPAAPVGPAALPAAPTPAVPAAPSADPLSAQATDPFAPPPTAAARVRPVATPEPSEASAPPARTRRIRPPKAESPWPWSDGRGTARAVGAHDGKPLVTSTESEGDDDRVRGHVAAERW